MHVRRLPHVLALALVVGAAAAGAEEGTIRATAPWKAQARVFITGAQQATMLGVLTGRLVVEQEPRALDGAQLLCPATFEADFAAQSHRGEGRCILTLAGGERIFGRWTCTGQTDHGCAGRVALTEGTGAYQGVTGEGDFTLGMKLSELVRSDQLVSDYELTGVMTWPGLRYRKP
jgi:hypothetical protein